MGHATAVQANRLRTYDDNDYDIEPLTTNSRLGSHHKIVEKCHSVLQCTVILFGMCPNFDTWMAKNARCACGCVVRVCVLGW